VLDWEIAASVYDYARDEQRTPSVAVSDPSMRGLGRIREDDGTGWNTVGARLTWRPQGLDGSHLIEAGYQRYESELRTRIYDTADWVSGTTGARVSAFEGVTQLHAVFLQDTWRLAERWRTTLGARAERWRASDGRIASGATSQQFDERSETYVSPKAALAYQWSDDLTLKASLGRAVRTPTVSELYQGSIFGGQIINNDPNLQPEKSWTAELTAQFDATHGSMRATAFGENTRDALYSQVNVTNGGTSQTVQNVDEIRTYGLELAYEALDVWLPGLDLSSSVTYAHSQIERNDNFLASVGKQQPRVPRWRGTALASYRIGERWVTSVGARYSGTQYNQLDNSDTNGTSYTGTSNYFVVDARVRYRIDERCTVSLGIDNLNNDKYWAFHPYPQRSAMAEVAVDF
jgi:iron complex outermembrane receptor protein